MNTIASARLLVLAGALLAAHACMGLAADPAFPVRPIRLIVPFVPGGSTDLLARIIAPRAGEVLGQQVVVDNRAGASSVIGTQIVAKAAPDGYTVLLADTAFAINASLFKNLPYDPGRDFAFVAILATSPTVLVANPRLKVRTIDELIAAARKSPGKITAANAGAGSNNHLEMEMFAAAAKIELLHVPFKGNGEAITSVIAGHTDLISTTPVTIVQHIKSGGLVALAISGKQPHSSLPGVPTYESIGLAAEKPESFRFIAAPRGLAEPVEKKLSSAFGAVMTAPDMQSRLKANGFDTELTVGAEARAYVAKAIRLYGEAVKRAGVKAD